MKVRGFTERVRRGFTLPEIVYVISTISAAATPLKVCHSHSHSHSCLVLNPDKEEGDQEFGTFS